MTVAVQEQVLALTPETRVVIEPVSWSLYQRILAELGNSRGARLAYDGGRLEIMSPSDSHEHVKTILARVIEAYADASGIDIDGLGSWTLKREDLEKGIESDECYYVQSFPAIAHKERLDLAVDPPPDLAIEVEIASSSLPKQTIYAALGVGEIWRFDGKRYRIFRRNDAGAYAESRQSGCFPDLPIDEVNRFVRIGLQSRQPAALRALREWMKQRPTGR